MWCLQYPAGTAGVILNYLVVVVDLIQLSAQLVVLLECTICISRRCDCMILTTAFVGLSATVVGTIIGFRSPRFYHVWFCATFLTSPGLDYLRVLPIVKTPMVESVWDVATYAGTLLSELRMLADLFPSVSTQQHKQRFPRLDFGAPRPQLQVVTVLRACR